MPYHILKCMFDLKCIPVGLEGLMCICLSGLDITFLRLELFYRLIGIVFFVEKRKEKLTQRESRLEVVDENS